MTVNIPPENLPPVAQYFPPAKGKYEVAPGLASLGTDFGNGAVDGAVFQLDRMFRGYREAKLRSRAERLEKYHCLADYDPKVAAAVAEFIARRLAQEHPGWFRLKSNRLDCRLTGETLVFDRGWQLADARAAGDPPQPGYVSALDALACQIQEDLAVMKVAQDGVARACALHLCFPNYWAPEDKIGRDFAAVHHPVPGLDRISQRSPALIRAANHEGPFVRFAWGLTTDDRLNHHPATPPDWPNDHWQGRQFDPAAPRLFLRVERQVLWGLPDVDAFLFTIRTFLTDCTQLGAEPARRQALVQALSSMNADSLAYKGLTASHRDIAKWLTEAGDG